MASARLRFVSIVLVDDPVDSNAWQMFPTFNRVFPLQTFTLKLIRGFQGKIGKKQGRIHGYPSRVPVGRCSAGEGHWSIWAGAMGPKSSKTLKK